MRTCSFRPWMLALTVAGLALSSSSLVRSADDEPTSYAGKEWTAPGGDQASTRFSTLSQINKSNVQQLGGAWSVDTSDRTEATPLVSNGRMFVVGSQGQVNALDPKTGAKLWTYDPPTPYAGKRGVGIGQGMLFLGLRDSNVIAISQDTGKLVWMSHHGADIPNQGMGTAPAYGNGIVVAVVSLGDNFLRGRAIGLEASTGKVLWSWDVVPGPGEPGHETWPQDSDIWKYGGGAIWTTPSVDTSLGLVYFGTGNAVPQYGGELRPGNNLYDNSVVALDIRTGKMRWYFQTIHHDIWEADMSTPMVLYDTEVGGQMRKVIAAMRTDGELFLLDRATGKPIIPVEERPVPQDDFLKTSATQPFPVGVDRIGPQCVPQDLLPRGFLTSCYFDPLRVDMPNTFIPNMTMRQAPMAYSPQNNQLYGIACVSPSWLRRGPTGWEFVFPVRPPGSKQYGILAALDSRTAKTVWQKQIPWAECYGSGGNLTTAGDLLFHLEPDGNFYAYDAKTGDVLWHFQTGQIGPGGDAGPSAGAPMSYEVDGQQYVAFANNRQVMAFRLGGTIAERPAPEPPPTVRGWTGQIQETNAIQIGTTRVYTIVSANKKIDFDDEYGVAPTRVKIVAGTKLTFTNKSMMPHSIVARDGSWTTGEIQPGQSATVTILKPGEYEYICAQHPWTIGQLIVEPQNSGTLEGTSIGYFTSDQALRGKAAYSKSCAACHQDDFTGTERIPALAGPTFQMNWHDKTVADLYNRTRLTMPQGNAGTLSPQTYTDIIAYILQGNGFSSGNAELMPNANALARIPMQKK